ncbi:chemotaxis protein CheD [Chitinivibrio alkaliphilus]|uniref:Probable chemoreceptor glutamine deamidase CheD n=1 Tax=Chitinivibrio alkaliphilus ACht1 TaxID=1313304 RepID=U7D996_9BACT|nr:chemotaxis protein CheD [Chitinivibrio alkaliphilus]ERP32156.1 chemotaxis protein CheD [Chitinivibrio alkaliphilus ACht1]
MSNTIILRVGDLEATNKGGAILKTYALGSCVAVMILDPRQKCISMAHVALPESAISPSKAKLLPGYFADTAVPELLEQMKKTAGEISRPRQLIVKLCGGASISDSNNTFNIGKRNTLAVKKALWKYGITPKAEDTGEGFSRTVTLFQKNGIAQITSPGKTDWKL